MKVGEILGETLVVLVLMILHESHPFLFSLDQHLSQ